ncbi:hypothetical protein [Actinokineospora sp.]|uniref:hypothetical protein n=1 Tax=Actinokineospora sp. TaxID=1872133 RepID=UPI003D6AFAE9
MSRTITAYIGAGIAAETIAAALTEYSDAPTYGRHAAHGEPEREPEPGYQPRHGWPTTDPDKVA